MKLKEKITRVVKKRWIKLPITLMIAIMSIIFVSSMYPVKQIKPDASISEFDRYMDTRVPNIMSRYDIPGAGIALVRDGETVWQKEYGYADIQAKRKMTGKDYFRVQSISKSITAWGIMKLVEQGVLELDKPVVAYMRNWEFPKSRFPADTITVKQLLTHTGGLYIGDFMTRYSPTEDRPDLRENLSDEAMVLNKPGTLFSYSNVGYNILELLIEEVTGRDFSEYMKHEVLLPLGMEHASFDWDHDFSIPLGYNLKGEEIPVYVYSHRASGGLFATMEDIAAFVAAGMSDDPSVINAKSVSEITTPAVRDIGIYNLVFDAYGYGHYIETLSDGKKAIAHGGQGTGWMTHFHAVPKSGDGIVILTNSQRSWPFIAYILSDWAQWSGLPALGMERLLLGMKLLWGLVGAVWFVVLLKLWRIAEGLVSKERCFAPLGKQSRGLRITLFAVSLSIFAGLLWCVCQDYLFITSIYPIVSGWLGVSLLALAGVLLLSAFTPMTVRAAHR